MRAIKQKRANPAWQLRLSSLRRVIQDIGLAMCKVVGHRKNRASVGSIGVLHCGRCYRIADQLTVRHRNTKGDFETAVSAYGLHWLYYAVRWLLGGGRR